MFALSVPKETRHANRCSQTMFCIAKYIAHTYVGDAIFAVKLLFSDKYGCSQLCPICPYCLGLAELVAFLLPSIVMKTPVFAKLQDYMDSAV